MVAIAMTLLILPLVETAGELDIDHLGEFFAGHWDLLMSFVISFLVIHVFWAAHGTVFRRLDRNRGHGSRPATLNMCWLLVIAFLPFPTAVVGRQLTTTSAPFYLGSMCVLSALTSAMFVVVGRAVGPSPRTRWVGLTTAVLAGCTLLSLVNADSRGDGVVATGGGSCCRSADPRPEQLSVAGCGPKPSASAHRFNTTRVDDSIVAPEPRISNFGHATDEVKIPHE